MIRFVLADRLRSFRERAGMTIYEVGDKIGRSGKTVSAWECGRGQPDADMLIALCRLYGVTNIAELYGETTEQKTPVTENGNGLASEVLNRLMSLTPDEVEKVDAFVQFLLASRSKQKVPSDPTRQ